MRRAIERAELAEKNLKNIEDELQMVGKCLSRMDSNPNNTRWIRTGFKFNYKWLVSVFPGWIRIRLISAG